LTQIFCIKLDYNKKIKKNKRAEHIVSPKQQISNGNLNIMGQCINRKITIYNSIFANSSSGNYTVQAGVDVRYLGIATITAGSSEFTNMATVYREVKVSSIAITILPIANAISTNALPPVCYYVDALGASSNPTNAALLQNENLSLVLYQELRPRTNNYKFSGVSSLINQWTSSQGSTFSFLPGAIYFGSTGGSFVNSAQYFQVKIDIMTHWAVAN
jgi:hypothetical protein